MRREKFVRISPRQIDEARREVLRRHPHLDGDKVSDMIKKWFFDQALNAGFTEVTQYEPDFRTGEITMRFRGPKLRAFGELPDATPRRD